MPQATAEESRVMALHSFSIENEQSLRRAVLDSVPNVTVIAGPNGVGKSTLLYAIKSGGRTEDPGTRILYQGPHRVMRSSSVQRRWIGGPMRWLRDLLTGNEVSGFDGLNFGNTNRTPSNVDEVSGTIKHILGRIENRRQALLALTVDGLQTAGSSLSPRDLPDVYAPLRELTEFILPHLRFLKVDFSNEDNIQCLFQRTDAAGTRRVDIDSLSSGEKLTCH